MNRSSNILRCCAAAAILITAGTGVVTGSGWPALALGAAGLVLLSRRRMAAGFAKPPSAGSAEVTAAQAEARWRESEQRFRKVFQASPTPIVMTRLLDGVIVAANEAFLKITGFTMEELTDRTAAELNIYASAPQRDEYIRAIREQGGIRNREQLLRTKEGEIRTILLSGELIELDGEPHLLTAGLDITPRKEAEAKLMQALDRERELSDMKSGFVSMVSHEFRTPLEVIQTSTDILDGYLDRLNAAERKQHLTWIQDSVRHMTGMMEDVLLLGRFEAGRFECQPDILHLTSWCRRFADEMFSATGGRSSIELAVGEFDPMVSADEKLLRHILGNLISNAVKYSCGTPVHLRIDREGGDAVFRVKDTGMGIPAEDRDRLFEAFHRGGNVGQLPGTGLGLVIVKRAVDLHGGSIAFSGSEGNGTAFTVLLPLFQQSA